MKILYQLEVWSYIVQDIKKPLSYLPRAILIGLAAAVTVCILQYICRRFGNKLHRLNHQKRTGSILNIPALFLFTVYLTVLLNEAYFSRPPGSSSSVNLKVLGTWGDSSQDNAYVIENIIMFICSSFQRQSAGGSVHGPVWESLP